MQNLIDMAIVHMKFQHKCSIIALFDQRKEFKLKIVEPPRPNTKLTFLID